MKTKVLAGNLSDLESKFDALKDNMSLYQQNINNNITWFYMLLTIVVTILLVALYFLVRQAVSSGIEKGIEKTSGKISEQIDAKREFLHAYGTASVSKEHGNLVQVYGLSGLSQYNFVNLTIVNRHGRVCEYHSLDIKNKDDIRGFDVKIVDYNPVRDGVQLYWNVIWMNNSTYEDLLRKK